MLIEQIIEGFIRNKKFRYFSMDLFGALFLLSLVCNYHINEIDKEERNEKYEDGINE